MTKLRWALAVIAAALVLVIGGTWAYINLIRDDPPPPLAFEPLAPAIDEVTSTTSDPPGVSTVAGDGADPDPFSGTWVPTGESVVGYRVGEVLFGQRTEAVGRTSDVDGEVVLDVLDVLTVRSAEFEVDMASVTSDDTRRDNQFRGRIMDVAAHPAATLRLVEPIALPELPADGEIVEVTATVELTLRGSSRVVPVDLQARRNGALVEITGSIPIVFDEWGIPNPSTVGITTDEAGDLEFLLVLTRA